MPELSSPRNLGEQLRSLPEAERSRVISGLTEGEASALIYDWEMWARPNQLAPATDWATWLILAGRGFGKTRCGAEQVRRWIKQGFRYVNFIAATADDIRDVMVEGESGILAICPKAERPEYLVSKRRLEWPNGAKTLLFTAEEPDRLRGKQHDKLWCFSCGTMIDTPCGRRRIETLSVGESVSTRFGVRRIVSNMARPASTGTVTFSDGSFLTGTGEHPVLTSNGWMTLESLSIGACVATVTSVRTSAQSGKTVSARMFTSIAGCGSRLMGLFLQKIRFTTKIKSRLTTPSTTSNVSPTVSIARSMARSAEGNRVQAASAIASNALGVVSRWLSNGKSLIRTAFDATESVQIKSGRLSERASSAERSSSVGAVSFAVSVVSTWAPDGQQPVYNLTIEDVHEYIANGIVVHNCDEVAAWRYADESWDQAMFGLRLGRNPQTVATTTPKPTKLIRQIIADKTTEVTRGTTYENRSNLAPTFYSKIITKYEGTRLGRQELNAEVLDDNPAALWKRSNIDANRVKIAPPLTRIVVGVDPAVTSNPDSDETGIIAAGRDGRTPPHFYVIADKSLIGTPDEWAKAAVNCYEVSEADRIIGEANNGGDLVETVLRHQNANISYAKVTASRGKTVRAEPIAALYEQNRVHHVGSFPVLEDTCCDWNPQDDSQDSPDRMDALVWALTELAGGADGYADFLRNEAREMATEGIITLEKPVLNVDGSDRNRCECGSTVWKTEAGKQSCFKCGKARPE